MSLTRMLSGILVAGTLAFVGMEGRLVAQAPSPAKQSVAGGGVTVDVTLLRDRSDAPAFQVVLDTHSVNLDGYRFEEIARLREETAQAQAALSKVTAGPELIGRLHEAAQMAASVNHEINNPLSVIVGNVQCLVMEKAATNQKALSRMRRIEAAALRIAKANRRLGQIKSLVESIEPTNQFHRKQETGA